MHEGCFCKYEKDIFSTHDQKFIIRNISAQLSSPEKNLKFKSNFLLMIYKTFKGFSFAEQCTG